MKQELQNKDLMRRAVRHLLVTDDDVMNEAERIVGHTLQRENQGDNGCLTVTEIARELEMEARDLNSFLRQRYPEMEAGSVSAHSPIRGAGVDTRQAFHLLLEGREKETSDLSRLDSQRSGIHKEVD